MCAWTCALTNIFRAKICFESLRPSKERKIPQTTQNQWELDTQISEDMLEIPVLV